MNKRVWVPAVLLASVLASPCAAAPRVAAAPTTESVQTVLEDQRRHGYASAQVALMRLQAARDAPGTDAPQELRRRYYAQVSFLAILARRPQLAADARAHLARMAEREHCQPCRAQWLIAQAQKSADDRDGEKALDYLSRARALPLPQDREMQLEFAYVEVLALQKIGNFPLAVEKALKGIELAERLGSTDMRIRLMIALIAVNADLGYTDRALAVANEAMALAKPLGHDEAMAFVWVNRGHAYARNGQRDQQFRALTAALEIARDVPGLEPMAVVSGSNLADYYLHRGDYRAALNQASRAAALARRVGFQRGLIGALANVGIAQSHLGDLDQGIAKLRESLALAREIDNKIDVVGITAELVKVLERAGRYREALTAMHEAAEVNDEITRQEREDAVMELQAKYDAARKNREIERLSAQNRLNQAQMDARSWQQRLWVAMAVALALAAMVLVQWLTHSRRSNQRLRVANESLAEQSQTDPLTGAFNRRHGYKLMKRHAGQPVSAAGEPAPSIGLMLLDIDHFKRINDDYGHAGGDAVLMEVVRRLQSLVREQDSVVRWGGEEFVLMLPGAASEGLAKLAVRVLHMVGSEPIMVEGVPVTVTLSAGCVAVPSACGQLWQRALDLADQAMYRAKQTGRNRAVCLMAPNAGLDAAALAVDLADADAAGQLRLRVLHGPRSQTSLHAVRT